MNDASISTNKNLPTREHIELAAYYLYIQSGFSDGHAEEHWLKAEKMLSMPAAEKNASEVLEAGGATKNVKTQKGNQKLMGSTK
jgi:hypothetical protein